MQTFSFQCYRHCNPQGMMVAIDALVPFGIRASAWLYKPVVVSIRSSVLHLWKYLLTNHDRIFLVWRHYQLRDFEAHAYHPISTKIPLQIVIKYYAYVQIKWYQCFAIYWFCQWNPLSNLVSSDCDFYLFIALIYLLWALVWQFQLAPGNPMLWRKVPVTTTQK